MGAITDPQQHADAVIECRRLLRSNNAIREHLCHHFRNCLSVIVCSADLAIRDKDTEALENHLHRIKVSCEHMLEDMEEVGL